MPATRTRKVKTSHKTRVDTEARAARVTALRDRLDEWQEDADEGLIAAALAQFDGYSERNAMLIAMQMPEATDVDGFRAWIARGRMVRKGEHGIQILAPAGNGRKGEDGDQAAEGKAEVVKEWTAPGHDPAAPGIEGAIGGSKPRQFFKIAHVFDVTQTDELPKDEDK